MVSRRVSRSVRRFAGGLVVLAFLAAVAAPAQAAPRGSATPAEVEYRLLEWVQDVLARLGFVIPKPAPAPEEEDGLRAVYGRDGCYVDPGGTPCSEDESTVAPPDTGFLLGY